MIKVFCADFETTSENNLKQDGYVRVWLWSLVNVDTKEEFYGTTIQQFIDKIFEQKANYVYFHNLRFDGYFLIHHLVESGKVYKEDYDCLISDLNIWYEIKLIRGKQVIKLWDSLKKFPQQSVNDIAKMYKIEGKKEKPYFDMYRPELYVPTTEEIEYCLQDSRIIAYAIQDQYSKGFKKMTLASDSFEDVKSRFKGKYDFQNNMPELKAETDRFVRESYKGGWTYLNPIYQEKVVKDIRVYDVNSLYPYVMRDTLLPYGYPTELKPKGNDLSIMKFEADFKLKDGYLPTIQIKNHPERFKSTEYVVDSKGTVELSMTNIDYKLFEEHYDIFYMSEPEYLTFPSKIGMLKDYIDYWIDVKIQASKEHDNATRFLAKRRLNSPYGKTGTKIERVNKVPLYENGEMGFIEQMTEGKPIYVPYASFVCSQARNITIRSAQKEIEHFVYADTDSLHLIGEETSGLDVDEYKLGAFKLEGQFDYGKYLRPKTYIHGHKDGSNMKVDEIKCAGMPDEIKQICTWDRFRVGEEFTPEKDGVGKRMQTRVQGGLIIKEYPFTIKDFSLGIL